MCRLTYLQPVQSPWKALDCPHLRSSKFRPWMRRLPPLLRGCRTRQTRMQKTSTTPLIMCTCFVKPPQNCIWNCNSWCKRISVVQCKVKIVGCSELLMMLTRELHSSSCLLACSRLALIIVSGVMLLLVLLGLGKFKFLLYVLEYVHLQSSATLMCFFAFFVV